MRVAPQIVLTDEERDELMRLVRSKLTSVRLVQHARIVLLALSERAYPGDRVTTFSQVQAATIRSIGAPALTWLCSAACAASTSLKRSTAIPRLPSDR